MTETIEKLKKSPLFNLSLSSKELFHSNFLYWIGINYPNQFGDLFIKFLREKPENSTIKEIFREKKNIDLSFNYNNGQEVLIENKVKSVPYIGQLKRYSKANSVDKNYILLSLSKPMFFNSAEKLEIDGAIWYYLSYSDLNNMLQIIVDKIENHYHKLIIEDYQQFIKGLIDVNRYCEIKENERFDFHSIKKNTIYKALMEIRLHDFYLKKKYELLAYAVYKRLKENGKNLIEFSQALNWETENSVIFIGYGMTRSLGLMDLKYLVSKNIILGIQIQGEHYRMVVEDNNSQIATNIKERLNDKKLWFDFSNSFPSKSIYPKSEKGFNKYGNTFFYKSVKLGTELTVDEIVSIVTKDVENIEKSINEIRTIITQSNNVYKK